MSENKEQRRTRSRTLRVQPNGRPSLLRDPSRHLRLHRCEDEVGNPSDCDVVLSQYAYMRIMKHLTADTKREHGGLLLGLRDKSANPTPSTILIVTSLPGEHTRGDPTSLTFTENTWLKFQEETDELERLGVKLQRLGWYHSHPNLGIFLSRWDLDVCTNFDQPHHVALVVDPIRSRGGFFPRGEHGYRPREPKGFWEYCDLKAESMIEWENTHEVSNEWRIPAYELWPFQIVEEAVEAEAFIEHRAVQTEPELTDEAADSSIVEKEVGDAEMETSEHGPDSAEEIPAASVPLNEQPGSIGNEEASHDKIKREDGQDKREDEADKPSRFAVVGWAVTKISKTLKRTRRAAPDSRVTGIGTAVSDGGEEQPKPPGYM